MNANIQSHRDLEVYRLAFDTAMSIYRLSKQFPKEETYSLTDQVRRSSRSVCANRAEAWRKRRYEGSFICKLSDAESEAGETQVWIEFAVKCEYLPREEAVPLYESYESVFKMIVTMINNPDSWVIGPQT
jgi:four helix bundle protein